MTGLISESTACVPTDAERNQRVVNAAIMWVMDQGCPNALLALEDAVCSLLGKDREQLGLDKTD